MEKIYLYNTLSRKKEEFKPIKKGELGIYACGPTVYNYAHIGNLRSYIFEDFLKRMFLYNGYKVKHVVNITDVGHLTGDMDMGKDKLEEGARRENKSAWELAEFYTQAFMHDIKLLNLDFPDIWCKATENIPEQIEMIETLEKKGYTYKTSDGIYFDTSKVNDYNKLSHLSLETLKEGARVEKNEEKRNATDFALWKFSKAEDKRQMEWESPWGTGFPGWHIECSAMSLKYLSKSLDIHCGGIDHINIHHTNEIAQSEAATGKKFFNYFLHNAFLIVPGGKKMAKSGDNFLTLQKAVIDKGFDPLAFRLLCSQVHYRKPMEYSPEILEQAQNLLKSLRRQVFDLRQVGKKSKGRVNKGYKQMFLEAINNDLNIPQALAILSKLLKSDLESEVKVATALDFDIVLGLDLDSYQPDKQIFKVFNNEIEGDLHNISEEAKQLLIKREKARLAKNYAESDKLRDSLDVLGYRVEDNAKGQILKVKE
jgi:cysteinyl-tRNA synthetase